MQLEWLLVESHMSAGLPCHVTTYHFIEQLVGKVLSDVTTMLVMCLSH